MEILKVTNLPDEVMLGKFKQVQEVVRGLSPSLSYDDKVCWVTDKVFVAPQYLVVGCLEEGVAYCFAAEIKGGTCGFTVKVLKGETPEVSLQRVFEEAFNPSEETLKRLKGFGEMAPLLDLEGQGMCLAEILHFIGYVCVREEGVSQIEVPSGSEDTPLRRGVLTLLVSVLGGVDEELKVSVSLTAVVPFSGLVCSWVRFVAKSEGVGEREALIRCFECLRKSYNYLVEERCSLSLLRVHFPDEGLRECCEFVMDLAESMQSSEGLKSLVC